MKKVILESLSPIWLGFALGEFADMGFLMWQFYAIIIPFFILNRITEDSKK